MASIICRTNSNNRPVVFLLDTLDFDNKSIEAWYPDTNEIESTTLDYYKTTKSMSDAEETLTANLYVNRFGLGGDFQIRRKLYRSSILKNLKPATSAQQPSSTIEKLEEKKTELEDAITQLQETVDVEDKPPYTEDVFQRKLLKSHTEFKERLIAVLTKAIRDVL